MSLQKRARENPSEKDKDLQKTVEDHDDDQLDMNNFMTLDEIGEVDIDEDGGGEDTSTDNIEKGQQTIKSEPKSPVSPVKKTSASENEDSKCDITLDPNTPLGTYYILLHSTLLCSNLKLLPNCVLMLQVRTLFAGWTCTTATSATSSCLADRPRRRRT